MKITPKQTSRECFKSPGGGCLKFLADLERDPASHWAEEPLNRPTSGRKFGSSKVYTDLPTKRKMKFLAPLDHDVAVSWAAEPLDRACAVNPNADLPSEALPSNENGPTTGQSEREEKSTKNANTIAEANAWKEAEQQVTSQGVPW
eukprot:CAMPEP_0119079322 /NCGR_PEP_ID=MMETSP1178-20130426/106273_1 /TAXON_ID=33656 /ORGANISM="unid sp, Strain CCMP2000" /LENGTH=145 /DNA_ID=CAMNT_0007061835 /DNA_START=119 /DNA_END=553 /DNA_ORIENTATION=+